MTSGATYSNSSAGGGSSTSANTCTPAHANFAVLGGATCVNSSGAMVPSAANGNVAGSAPAFVNTPVAAGGAIFASAINPSAAGGSDASAPLVTLAVRVGDAVVAASAGPGRPPPQRGPEPGPSSTAAPLPNAVITRKSGSE